MAKKRQRTGGGGDGDDASGRNWSDLPELVLHLMTKKLTVPEEFLSFSSVCRAWRSLAISCKKEFMASQPPLFLAPLWDSREMRPEEKGKARQRWRPRSRPTFFISTPAATAAGQYKYYKAAQLPNRVLHGPPLGISHGYLIMTDARSGRPVLLDPFTGEETRPFPKIQTHCICDTTTSTCCILTAPPSSPHCCIVLYDPCSGFHRCRRTRTGVKYDSNWSSLHDVPPDFNDIVHLANFKGRVCAVTKRGWLMRIDFFFGIHVPGIYRIGGLPNPFEHTMGIGPFIVEYSGRLLLIHCVPPKERDPLSLNFQRIDVYQMKWRDRKWVKMRSLGGCALFIDPFAPLIVCPHPERWGGRKDHIYFAGPGHHQWVVYDLNANQVDYFSAPIIRRNGFFSTWPWPRPLWGYPSSWY